MDWIKLNEDIYKFATKLNIKAEESNTTYIGGQVTTYQLLENSSIFYEIKHSMPKEEYGSKVRIYSKTEGQITIDVKRRFFGKLSLNSNIDLNVNLPLKKVCGL